jgi:MerR family transcriptional regulator/heat shock protein HspR
MSILRVFYHDEGEQVPVAQLDIHPEFLQLLAELGIIEIRNRHIDSAGWRRTHRIMRIRQRLGVNMHAAAIIVELLERIESLEEEIERLKK